MGGGEGAGGDGGPCIPANPVCAAGGYGPRSAGGAGGLVIGQFSTPSGSNLNVLVGCPGSMNNVGSGGGGGLSGVFSGAPSSSTALIVAGGGGGGGIDARVSTSAANSGGSGGFSPVTPTAQGKVNGTPVASSAQIGGLGGMGFGGGGGVSSSYIPGMAGTPFGTGGSSEDKYSGQGGFGGGGSGGGYTTSGLKTEGGGGGGGGMPGGNGGKWNTVYNSNTGTYYGRGYGGYGGTSYISPAVKLISSGTVEVSNSAGYANYPAESGYVTLKFYN